MSWRGIGRAAHRPAARGAVAFILAAVGVATLPAASASADARASLPLGWIERFAGVRIEGADALNVDLMQLGITSFVQSAAASDGSVVFAVGEQVFRFGLDRIVHRLGGTGIEADYGDGSDARSAGFGHIVQIDVDAGGNVLVVENLNTVNQFRVRRIDAATNRVDTIAVLAHDRCPSFNLAVGEALPCVVNSLVAAPDGNFYIGFSAGGPPRLGVLRPDGSIAHIAGNGVAAPSGYSPADDGLNARGVSFGSFFDFTADASGNVFLADPNSHRIVLIDQAGRAVAVAGNGTTAISGDGGPARMAGLGSSFGLAADDAGVLYISSSDAGDRSVRRVDQSGQIQKVAAYPDTLQPGTALDVSPANGNVVVLTSYPKFVTEIGRVQNGTIEVVAGHPAVIQDPSYLARPVIPADPRALYVHGIAVDRNDGVLAYGAFRDLGAQPGVRFDQDGSAVQSGGGSLGVAVGADGTVYRTSFVTGFRFLDIAHLDGTFESVDLAVVIGPVAATLSPVAVANNGDVFVGTEDQVYRLRKAAGVWSSLLVAGNGAPCGSTTDACAGADGDPATAVSLFKPRGLAVAPDGSLLMAETAGAWVRRVDQGGRIHRFAGTGQKGASGDGGPAAGATLAGPTGVASAPDGSVFVADFFGSRLRKISPVGTIGTVAGDGTYEGRVERGPAQGPVFVGPTSVAIDSKGYVYVLDVGLDAIVRVAPSIDTVLGPVGDRVSALVSVPPVRLLDTRAIGGPPLSGNTTVDLSLSGAVPEGATAAVINLTITNTLAPGFVQAFPTGRATIASSSTLNVEAADQTVPNMAVVPIGDANTISLFTQGGGDFVVDLLGYFQRTTSAVSEGRYAALAPTRVLDTRESGRLVAGDSVQLPVLGAGGVPASGVGAVAMNVTLTEADRPGFVQVIPTGGPTAVGASSNLNASHAGQTVANMVIVPVGSDGSVTLFTHAGGQLVVDITGYYTDTSAVPSVSGLFVAAPPTRLLDTRGADRPGPGGAVVVDPSQDAGQLAVIDVLLASALVTNLTATEAAAPGFVQAVPTNGASFGSSSNLNVERPGQTIANAAQVTLGSDHTLTLFTQTGTHLICDVTGWYTR